MQPSPKVQGARPGCLVTGWKSYSLPATVVKIEVRFEPTVPMIVTAATAISAAIRPYSIAVAPSSFLKSLVKVINMPVLQFDGRSADYQIGRITKVLICGVCNYTI